MRQINKVLVTAWISEENKKKLSEALAPAEVRFVPFFDKQAVAQAVQGVDVAILNSDLDDSILADPEIRWIHCCRAGVEKSARPEVFERGIVLTSSSGRSAPALAEHAMMFLHALTYDIPFLMRNKAEHKWRVTREYAEKTGLYGKTVGIIGLGKTGTEVARLCKAYDMRVLGWRRSDVCPENVDRVYSSEKGESILPILEQSDYVVLSVELNDETWHLLGAEELAHMKETAYLVNMGRGGLIDEPALIEALQQHRIAGAGLDTVETEPLPEDSPLWDLENVILTPHVTPRLPDKEERMLSYVFANIEAYRNETPMQNLVTERNMFTKG